MRVNVGIIMLLMLFIGAFSIRTVTRLGHARTIDLQNGFGNSTEADAMPGCAQHKSYTLKARHAIASGCKCELKQMQIKHANDNANASDCKGKCKQVQMQTQVRWTTWSMQSKHRDNPQG